MKRSLKLLLITLPLLALMGCDRGLSERERECMELTADAEHCIHKANRHVVHHYEPRQHINYYGHPEYGYWNNGVYVFHDPRSSYATSTEAFLLGAGLGTLAAYKMSDHGSREYWEDRNPSGWKERKQYFGKNGKKISKAEYDRRKRQSTIDKAKNKSKPIVRKPISSEKLVKKPIPPKRLVNTTQTPAKRPVIKKTDPSLYKKTLNTKTATKNTWKSGKTSNNWNKTKTKPKTKQVSKPRPKPTKKY